MDKFSKINKRKKEIEKKEDILYSDDNLKVINFEDWSIVSEKNSVFCIPYLIETNQMILRYEYIPTFKYVDNQDYHITVVGGGIEKTETPDIAMIRELEEETGIVLNENYKLEQMKPFFISKGITSKIFLYLIPLNERDYTEKIAKGDGSKIEKKSKSVKVDAKYINAINSSDLITEYLILKLKEYLNI